MVLRPCVALLHPPTASASAWGEVPDRLTAAGWSVVTLDVETNEAPPNSSVAAESRFVARAALELAKLTAEQRVVLVGHGDAGPLLPQLGFARAAAGLPVAGYVFVDAALPTLPLTFDWPDARCAYLQLSADYAGAFRTAGQRGWDVSGLDLHHNALLTHPEEVAAAIGDLLNVL